jgi:hypothetical protein
MAVVKRTNPILDRKVISWVLQQLEQLIGLYPQSKDFCMAFHVNCVEHF